MSFPIRIILLGDICCQIDSQYVSLPQRESLRRLATRLFLQPRQPIPRKQLAFTIWPDTEPDKALANLRRHLHLLRNLLPPAMRAWLIVSTRHIIWNAPAECQSDVHLFEQGWASVHELEAIVGLYRGDLAPGVDTDDDILVRREALRQRYLKLLTSLVYAWMKERNWDRATHWAQLLNAHDPWNEEGARLAMTALTLAGQRTAALAIYQKLAHELEHELHLQPAAETTALYNDIVHHRLGPAPSPDDPPTTVTFVGRADELRRLDELMRRAAQGQGSIAFVSGEPGVGKTALVQEAARRYGCAPDKPPALVCWGYCQPFNDGRGNRPYTPWRHIFTSVTTRLVERAGIATDWLSRLLPLVPDLAGLCPELSHPSQPDAAALRAAIRQGVQALASRQPVILIIEDAHWIDHWSLDALNELTDVCQSLPVLLIVTHRSGAAPRALLDLKQAMRRRFRALDIHVAPFTPTETDLFLNSISADIVDARTREEVRRYAGNFPLFLREAIESLRQAHQQRESHQTPLTGLRDVIRLRLRDIGRQNRQMLEAAAILGFSFNGHELQQMLAWPPAIYVSALDELLSRRLLFNTVVHSDDDFVFSHHLIHDIILNDIPADRAAELHNQAAGALERLHTDQPGYAARIATHYEKAGSALAAARFWLAHARENTDLAAFDQAMEAIARVEMLAPGSSRRERELRAQIAAQRGMIALYQGDATSALDLLQCAMQQSREFPALYTSALITYAYALYTRDRAAESRAIASQALELASSLQDTIGVTRALNIRGVSSLMIGQIEDAVADLQRACELVDRLRQDDINARSILAQTTQSLNHLGTALVFAQKYEQGREILNRAVAMAQRSGLPRLEAAALTMIGQMTLNCGRYDEAIQVYTRSIDVAGASYRPGMWGKYAGRGWVSLRLGELVAARQDFVAGLDIANQVNSQYGALLMQTYLTFVDLAQGRKPTLSLAQLAMRAEELRIPPVVYMACLLAGQLWRLLGDSAQALEMHERALQAAQTANVPSFILHARAQQTYDRLLAAHDTAASADLDQIIEQAHISGELPVQSLAWLARAAYLHQCAQPTAALGAAEKAVIIARACPDVPLIGEGLALLARIRASAGQSTFDDMELMEAQAIARQHFAPLALLIGLPEAARLRQYCLDGLIDSPLPSVAASCQPTVHATARKRRASL
ncbi:ATP-binding protein [Chloroflexus sp.]|uniref:ATP-binding protein n=1 Tax=Chloroflexus sp. TaxID=1904827 RepID=UPI00262384EA|nr:AAA family ATPase [uncultured Chloroflexus sp.]